MADRLVKQWDADPNGELVLRLYETTGILPGLWGLLTSKVVDVPSGVSPHYYEAVPMLIKGNQRIVVVKDGLEGTIN